MKTEILTNPDEAVKFSQKLCGNITSRSYPMFENADAMQKEYSWSVQNEKGALYGAYENGELAGVLCAFRAPCSRYVQTTGVYAETYAPANALISRLVNDFPHDRLAVGIPAENAVVADVLCTLGFTLSEDSYDFRLCKQKTFPITAHLLEKSEHDAYLAFHAKHFDELYWNARKLRWGIDNWEIFTLGGKDIRGSVFAKREKNMVEVFGMYAETPDDAFSLLSSLVSHVFAKYPALEELIFMAGTGNSVAACEQCGFENHGHYNLWEK